MQKEGLFPQFYYKVGFGTGDSQKYGILKEDWVVREKDGEKWTI